MTSGPGPIVDLASIKARLSVKAQAAWSDMSQDWVAALCEWVLAPRRQCSRRQRCEELDRGLMLGTIGPDALPATTERWFDGLLDPFIWLGR
ncbi:MAG TPA: hypothetical protein VMZ11_03830 [Mycobacteriales bacterium]|nr:hypothetical protein [Mycobacteriales bacterium]